MLLKKIAIIMENRLEYYEQNSHTFYEIIMNSVGAFNEFP